MYIQIFFITSMLFSLFYWTYLFCFRCIDVGILEVFNHPETTLKNHVASTTRPSLKLSCAFSLSSLSPSFFYQSVLSFESDRAVVSLCHLLFEFSLSFPLGFLFISSSKEKKSIPFHTPLFKGNSIYSFTTTISVKIKSPRTL